MEPVGVWPEQILFMCITWYIQNFLLLNQIVIVSATMDLILFSRQESSSRGHDLEDAGGKSSGGDLGPASVPPPPPKWRSHQDLEKGIKTVQNGEFSGHQSEPLTSNHTQRHLQMSASPQNAAANGTLHNLTPNSSDIFKPLSAQTQSPSSTSPPKGSDPLKDDGFSLFHAAKEENLFQHNGEKSLFDASPHISADPFTSNKPDDPSEAPQPRGTNPFYTATPRGADVFQPDPIQSVELFQKAETKPDCPTKDDLFGMTSPKNSDVFSPSFTNTVDPFPSPITRDLFRDLSSLEDPFSPTPAKKYNPFHDVSNGTADIFQPLPSETTPDSFSSPAEVNVDALQSSTRPRDVILTTPQGTNHNILHPTPFTRARNLSMSPELTHVCSKYCFLFTHFVVSLFVFYSGQIAPRRIYLKSLFQIILAGLDIQTPAQAASSDSTTEESEATCARKATKTGKAAHASDRRRLIKQCNVVLSLLAQLSSWC